VRFPGDFWGKSPIVVPTRARVSIARSDADSLAGASLHSDKSTLLTYRHLDSRKRRDFSLNATKRCDIADCDHRT
jgi:hypothetical protein